MPSGQEEDRDGHAEEDADDGDLAEADEGVAGGEAERAEADDVGGAAEEEGLAGAVPELLEAHAGALEREGDVDGVVDAGA